MGSLKFLHFSIRLLLIISILAGCSQSPTPTAIPTKPTSKPPTITPTPNNAPTAMNSDLYVEEGSSASLDLNSLVFDLDDDQLTFSIPGTAHHGETSLVGSMLKYIPTADYLGSDQLTYEVSDEKEVKAKATISITVSIAPALNPNEVTDFAEATDFLYTGNDPIQTGVASGTIEERRVAVLRGNVMDSNNRPLVGVKITVLDHPEYGETLTRDGGVFDIAVNGGGWLTLNYEKENYMPVQRKVEAPWRDYAQLPDVVLIPQNPKATQIDLSDATTIQVVRGAEVTDKDGTRRETLFFPQGTNAYLRFADGTKQPVTKLNIHITEYTVGPNGEKAMPGELPPTTAYTYATELSAEEVTKKGAETVLFDPPIISYNENFLNFPVGVSIPMGYYDKEHGQWVSDDNGRVVKILSITSGKAELDVVGAGQVATPTELSALGITDAELAKLPEFYSAGQSLWRTPVSHFSSWDKNMKTSPEEPAPEPPTPEPETPPNLDTPEKQCGSIIGCENQTLGEMVELIGTPFQLHYQSQRVDDYKAGNILVIPLSGASVSPTLKRIDLNISVAGRLFEQSFAPKPNLRYQFVWDGKDAYGRLLHSTQIVKVDLTYVYPLVYQETDRFGYNGSVAAIKLGQSTQRAEFTITKSWIGDIGGWKTPIKDLGGWALDIHHRYDPQSKMLLLGSGEKRSADSLNFPIIETAVMKAGIQSIVAGPDGSLYMGAFGWVYRMDPHGAITPFAGDGKSCSGGPGSCGDGGPATQARLYSASGLALGPDGSLYIAEGQANRIRRVGADGIITTVAGNGRDCPIPYNACFEGDGGPATQARLGFPMDVAVGPDGSLYIADKMNARIRRVDASGIILTVAGGGNTQPWKNGIPATSAIIGRPEGIEVAGDGSLYILSRPRISRVLPDGVIWNVAGTGSIGRTADGKLATQASIDAFGNAIVMADGSLLFLEKSTNYCKLRSVSPQGVLTTMAGKGNCSYGGDGGPAQQAGLDLSGFGSSLTLGPDGSIYIAEYTGGYWGSKPRVSRLRSALPGVATNENVIASEDGSEIYIFDSDGRHLWTRHALTGAILYKFEYKSDGQLWKIIDGNGNITEIQRDTFGHLTKIVAPFSQTTSFTLDTNGYLKTITNPANETIQFTYTDNGLMTSMTDARNFTHNFEYDQMGRLKRDENPASSFTTLSRVEDSQSYTVTVDTALHRPTKYRVERLSNDAVRRVNTYPDGTTSEHVQNPDGTRTWRSPDGTTQSITLGTDPRWLMLAPVTSQLTITTPDGLSLNAQEKRTATLKDPNDPFSLVTLSDTITVNGRTYTSTYTAATRTWVSRSPEGRGVTTTIDTQGRIVLEQVSGLAPANYVYDKYGRLETATLGTGADARQVSFMYNNEGYLETIIDPLKRTVKFEYDLAGRIIKQTLPDQRIIGYTYDENGNLKTLTPPGKPAHTFDYTAIDLVKKYIPPDVNTGADDTQYDYNTDRQLTIITRPDGKQIKLGYDMAGRLDTLTIARGIFDYGYNATTGNLETLNAPGNINLTYGYDGGLLKSQTWSGSITGSVSRTYDNNFWLETLAVNGSAITYSYDNDGLLKQVGDLALTPDPQNGLLKNMTLGVVADTFTYTPFGELDIYSVTQNNMPLFSQDFEYDALGRIHTKTETVEGVSHVFKYIYDTAGRLHQVKKDNVLQSTYTYNSNGNRDGGKSDAQDRMTAYGANSYTYTANGELETKTNGGQTTQYRYDELGNLSRVILPDSKQIDYLIDGQNRRVGKKVNGMLTETFLYQGQLRPIAQFDGDGNLLARFIYATHINVPNYMIKNGVTYRLILDQLGSPRLIVNTADGTIAQKIEYDEFGSVLNDTNPGFQPFGFAGGLYDPDTSLVRFGARDYDAEVGRWTTKDPIGINGGMNVYAYVNNGPINLIDATGQLFGTYPPVAPPPVATVPTVGVGAAGAVLAVIVAFGVGYAIGTGINYLLEDSIQNALTRFLPDAPTTTVQLPPDLFDKYKDLEHDRYTKRCTQSPPLGLSKCEMAKWRAAKARDCALMREAWDRRYSPGEHDDVIGEMWRAERNALLDVAKNCPPPPGCN